MGVIICAKRFRKSALKRQRLLEANEAYQLNRRLEDLDKWLERVEMDLSSEDHGKDYSSAEALIKKQDDLNAEIASRRDNVRGIVNKAQEFEKKVAVSFRLFPCLFFLENPYVFF